MPKILIYITAKITWIFLFYGTDVYENRAHVHVGRKDTDKYCKIWLEPEVSIAKNGDLTDAQATEALKIVEQYKERLLGQWQKFKNGQRIKMITIKK